MEDKCLDISRMHDYVEVHTSVIGGVGTVYLFCRCCGKGKKVKIDYGD